MNPGYLILHPTSQPPSDLQALLKRLSDTGLIGTPLPQPSNGFLAGPRFLQRITFLGCSPNLPLPGNSESARATCTVQLLGPYPAERLITDHNCRPPRCHGCGHSFREWRDRITQADWQVDCPECKQAAEWPELNWRQTAGAARLFIAISQVFPGEAVPTGGLLETLREGSGDWAYFYAQQPLVWPAGNNPLAGENHPTE